MNRQILTRYDRDNFEYLHFREGADLQIHHACSEYKHLQHRTAPRPQSPCTRAPVRGIHPTAHTSHVTRIIMAPVSGIILELTAVLIVAFFRSTEAGPSRNTRDNEHNREGLAAVGTRTGLSLAWCAIFAMRISRVHM